MASVQDRLKLKRVPLDNWSISEQLYLASAVACSGDQNWMSVSRALKMSCGGDRPSDWFSQKSCAAQYGKLLENVETPKRKKRNEKDTSQTTVDTPSELILRKLTHERMSELKKLIHDDRQEYLQCKEEIASIETGAVDELQLMEMWKQIEEEEMQREKNQQKHAEWLKVCSHEQQHSTIIIFSSMSLLVSIVRSGPRGTQERIGTLLAAQCISLPAEFAQSIAVKSVPSRPQSETGRDGSGRIECAPGNVTVANVIAEISVAGAKSWLLDIEHNGHGR